MPITTEQLIRLCREGNLYHVAHGGSWPSIQEHGLRSTSALLDLFEIKARDRHAIESQHRPASREIFHPVHGEATIRDQEPLNIIRLQSCLNPDCTVEQYLRLLNSRVFFWLNIGRVGRMLEAYPGVIHDLLVIDASSFINAYFEKIRLSPINSGATLFNAPNRGLDLFKTLDDFPFEERRHRGNDAVAELTVEGKVGILRFVTRVERTDGTTSNLIYER